MAQTESSEIKGDILIVDDDLVTQRLLSQLLVDHGFEVRNARDGSIALMMVEADPPDLILLDIQMPGMDGYQVCEQLKFNPATRNIPVLFISARDEILDKVNAFRVGAVDYINKPFHIEEIVARIKAHLTISRLHAELVARLDELSALHQIAKTITVKRELPQTLELICTTISDLFRVRLSFIVLLENESMWLKGLVGYERTSGTISLTCAESVHMDSSIPQLLVNEGKPVVITCLKSLLDDQSLPLPKPVHDYLQKIHLQSVLIVPLISRGTVLGILVLAKGKSDSSFQSSEIDLIETIASDIAVAIENDRLVELARLAAVVDERKRLARELHDSVTQSIYSLTLLCSGWENMARQGTLNDPADAFQRLGAVGQQALREMRLLLHQMRPSILAEEGLVNALRQRLDTVERRANIDSQLVVQGEVENLLQKIEDELFNIAQEALNNSLKHAQAESVVVQIVEDQGRITLLVADDGVGFDPSIKHPGMGLMNMRERANSIGAALAIRSENAHGTQVTVSVMKNKDNTG